VDHFSYEFKKTAVDALAAVFVELKKTASKVADKGISVRHADIVFNTKREKRF
jgi:hypothetical protein